LPDWSNIDAVGPIALPRLRPSAPRLDRSFTVSRAKRGDPGTAASAFAAAPGGMSIAQRERA